jgi:hypothetical protein
VSNAYGNQQLPAGWYADPAGSPQLRWWDGTQWTEHLHAPTASAPAQAQLPQQARPGASVPGYGTTPAYGAAPGYGAPSAYGAYAPAPAYAGVAQYPSVAPGTPVYGPLIWIITLLPVISYLLLPLLLGNVNDMVRQAVADPYAYRYGVGGSMMGLQLGSDFIGLVFYAAIVVMAYFDHKQLAARGFVRPFHWAWSFLSGIVYVIGRSVVVKRRAGHGIAPMWVTIGLTALGFIIGLVIIVSLFSTIMSTVPTSLNGSYT